MSIAKLVPPTERGPFLGVASWLQYYASRCSKDCLTSLFCVSEIHVSSTVKIDIRPWLVWLSGLSAGLWTKGLPVQFPVRAHAWVVGQVPSRGCFERQPQRDVSLPPFPSVYKQINTIFKKINIDVRKERRDQDLGQKSRKILALSLML